MKVKYIKEELVPIVKRCKSVSAVRRELGLSTHGASVTHLKKRLIEFGIDISHFDKSTKGYKLKPHNRRKKYDVKEFTERFLKYNGANIISDVLKKSLLEKGLLKNKCEMCGNDGEWLEKKLTLQLDHINGVREDNRLENLRILCPNCHSQTHTYSGKNQKRKRDE